MLLRDPALLFSVRDIMHRRTVIGITAAGLVAPMCRGSSGLEPETTPVPWDELLRRSKIIESLKLWQDESSFADSDWDRYLSVASLLASAPLREVEDTFLASLIHMASGEKQNQSPWSRVMILIRLIYVVPNDINSQIGDGEYLLAAGGVRVDVAGGTQSTAATLPVLWVDGRPILAARLEKRGGQSGSRYNPMKETRWCEARLARRTYRRDASWVALWRDYQSDSE